MPAASIAFASDLSMVSPAQSAGSWSAMRNCLASFSSMAASSRRSGPAGKAVGEEPREVSGDENRHCRIEIGRAAHDADVGEFRLRLTGEMRKDARAQRLGGGATA